MSEQMKSWERKLVAVSLVFVAVYVGAIVVTIQSRISEADRIVRFESAEPLAEERHLMMAELFLPMLILLTVAVSYMLLQKKRQKVLKQLDADEAEAGDRKDP
jgi:NADH:ubiquinone oxidoreductase subunit 6 (subunit J)